MSTFHYFAYGSNMLRARLLARTPSARSLGAAALTGHALRWHMVSRDGSGKCDIVPDAAADAVVHGVLYQIALHDKPALDAAESLGVGYAERQLTVHAAAGALSAWAYVALVTQPDAVPYDWYKGLVVHGAHEHALPADYLAHLSAAPSQPDADAERARLHFALVRSLG